MRYYWLWILVKAVTSVDNSIDQYRRDIQIVNESGRRIDIFWVSTETNELLPQLEAPVVAGAGVGLSSFVGHTFEARELPSTKTNSCVRETCHAVHFTVNNNDNQMFYVRKGWTVDVVDDQSRALEGAADLMEDCEKKAQEALRDDSLDITVANTVLEELMFCVKQGVAAKLQESSNEINYQAKLRMAMADKWENYTCQDNSLPTSDSLRSERWNDAQVEILHDKESSQIHVLHNFISEDECIAMEEAAEPLLHKATVASGDGGSQLSDNRKAMQAGINVPWHHEDHPISQLSRRVYDYTNHVLNLGIEEHGQENLMSIQYFGRPDSDESPDQYMPHCDGDCDAGLPHKHGTRVATMVMYCTVASKGGATNFKNAGIHVKPEPGSAVFFSYVDPNKMIMDKGFTVHSGCPVIEGAKKIVTQWIRHGVDSVNRWDTFNTLGVKYSDLE